MESSKKKPAKKKGVKKPSAAVKVSRTHRPDGMGIEEWQLELRRQFGRSQSFAIRNIGNHPIFSEFSVENSETGRTYRTAIRGSGPGENYCSCPDFRINSLGTCKHIECVLASLMKKRGAAAAFKKGFMQPYSEIYLRYGMKREVFFKPGLNAPDALLVLAKDYFGVGGALMEHRLNDFGGFISKLPAQERHEVRFYDDALEFIAMKQDEAHRMELIEKRLPDGAENAIFESLLKTRLYPYQKQGALFAARAGRCLIGDDMGLGKTIQALAAVELMAGLFGISKVLIVSPTSLKYQWLSEINKFTGRTAQVIEGMSHKHKSQFETTSFYKLINYELVSRDVKAINDWAPDLIILDEAQRIKNWQTRTAKTIKSLQSQFAIVLTGTPVENKIEELHSIVEFIDMHHLGPLYRFVHDHRITEGGSSKVVGYKNLDRIRKSLEGVMIRRKKSEVLKQLPERIDKIFSVPMTKEQADIHEENREVVARLAMKWRRYRFLSDADLRRMQIALANMRMVSDNTYLIDARTNHGPKIDELEILVKELVVEAGEKAVIFSQWIRMNTLIEEVLNKNGVGFVHLNGNVPSKDRKELMNRFKNDPSCRVFLSTDAGGVGLNLQSGSIVINMDVPWNPAVLEQRIGRVHRMGQKNSVRVINFVTKGSIEERILDLIQFKKALFAGALDIDGADFVEVGKSGLEGFMKTVEEATVNLEKDPSQIIDDALKPEEEVVTQEKDEPVEISAVTSGQPDFTGFISGINPEKIQNFLLAGARFMDSLASAINKDDNVATVNYNKIIERAGNLIVKDESTGGDCLKIPIPKPQVINELASAFGAVISSLLK